MARTQLTDSEFTLVVDGSLGAASLVSVEGVGCRLYTEASPTDADDGHLVRGGYQIVIPDGVMLYARRVEEGSATIVASAFGLLTPT